jgi:hypothetical protein
MSVNTFLGITGVKNAEICYDGSHDGQTAKGQCDCAQEARTPTVPVDPGD